MTDQKLPREELERCLNVPKVRAALTTAICKFPSEWNRDNIDARWDWLQSDPDYAVSGDDWIRLRAHISALTVPAASLPAPLAAPHWHFHPQNFITHFRKCHWLSAAEFKQLVPRHAMRRHAGVYLWEEVHTNLTAATSVAVSQRVGLNRMTRKYGINSPLRLASFYGNAIQETQWFGLLAEGGGPALWYAPWYGRAAVSVISQRSNATLCDAHFPQLTAQMRGWRDEVKGVAMANSTDAGYAPSDSAGFYWAKLRMASYADADHALERRSVATNMGTHVYYRRSSFCRASAAVNLPNAIDNQYSTALNGFDACCVAYAYSLAGLSETLFPDSAGNAVLAFQEGYLNRRN